MPLTTLGHDHHANKKVSYNRVIEDTVAATTTSATGIDCSGGSQASVIYFVTHVNTLTAENYFTLSCTESATEGGAYTAVAAERMELSAHSTTDPQPLITAGNEVLIVTVDPTKPFLKAVLTMTGTASVDADVTIAVHNLESIA